MLEKVNILVVEDEPIVAKDIEKRLKKLGYSVVALVDTGEGAIKEAKEKKPDLVLMDIKLHGEMDGIQTADLMVSRFDIPVVYLTAYADDTILNRAKLTTPFGYILKPFETRELHTAIEIALYRHKMEKKLKESEERYLAYVTAISQIIWIIDPDEEVASDVPTWKAFFARQNKEAIKENNSLEKIHPDDRERVTEIFLHAVSTKSLFETKFRLQGEEKKYRHVFVRGVPVIEKDGNIREWIGTSNQITGHE